MKTLFGIALIAIGFSATAQNWTGPVGIGIGSNTPQSKLHVSALERYNLRLYRDGYTGYLSLWQGTGASVIEPIGYGQLYLGYDQSTDIFMSPAGGKVGIGNSAPASQLHLTSNSDHSFTISRNNGQYGFRIFRDAAYGVINFQIGSGVSTWETKIRIGEGEGTNTALFLNPTNGNVVIGRTAQGNSAYKLDVNGTIRANEIVVNATGADFVFEQGYQLPTLEEVEEFIRTNKHLPDIEPAHEMEQNGVEVGKMETKLLQKIEEMTLYMIELKKEIGSIKEENSQLKNRIEVLEKR